MCWATADDVSIGSPPLAFTFGLGGLLAIPLAIGAYMIAISAVQVAVLIEDRAKVEIEVTAVRPVA